MSNTYEVIGICDPDGTLKPYGTTTPKAAPVVVAEDKLIATAAANQTYGAQLTHLKTYYQALSDEEKVRSELRDSFGQIFPLTNLETGTFSLFELYGPTNVNRISFIFSSEKVYQITSATNYDLTSETDTGSISLYVRNALGQVDGTMDAHNVTYGDSDVDTALTELNSKIPKSGYFVTSTVPANTLTPISSGSVTGDFPTAVSNSVYQIIGVTLNREFSCQLFCDSGIIFIKSNVAQQYVIYWIQL